LADCTVKPAHHAHAVAKRTIKDVIAHCRTLDLPESFFTDHDQALTLAVTLAPHCLHQRYPHCTTLKPGRPRPASLTTTQTWAQLAQADICPECWSGKALAAFLSVGSGYYSNATPLALAWALSQSTPKLEAATAALHSPSPATSTAAGKLALKSEKLAQAAETVIGRYPQAPWQGDYQEQVRLYRELLTKLGTTLTRSDPVKENLLTQVRRFHQAASPFPSASLDESPCLVIRADRGISFDFPQTEKLIHQIIRVFSQPHRTGRPILAVPRYVADYLLISLPNHPRRPILRVTPAPADSAVTETAIALWDPESKAATSDLAVAVATAELLLPAQSSSAS
jgi:hypothetical protein